jgi:aspartate/methionine/tyrosine aminotransferase
MFSSRFPSELAPNALSRAVGRRRQAGEPILDLTETNPTAVRLSYPSGLLSVLADDRSLVYRPDPMGILEARTAIAERYQRRGVDVDARRIALTASTSEAYGALFKMFCNPGDAVLVPQPSYPLFELLAGFDSVHAVPYRLRLSDAWAIDRDSLLRALSPATRAILVVAPNNPTGSLLRADDREWLVALADRHDLPLIADEVFTDYPLTPRQDATGLAGERRALTIALGGLSKSAGLPQLKLAWMAVSGPDGRVRQALEHLALVLDTYLSVATPVQVAAGRLLAAGETIREAIAGRLRQNLDLARRQVRQTPALTLFEPEGGWSAVIRVPATDTEENIVLGLVSASGVLVHPGYFFDFAEEAFLVVSLLPEPEIFEDAMARLAIRFADSGS